MVSKSNLTMRNKRKVLVLTLHKAAFDVMVTGEKRKEYRETSKWMLSRLFNKDGSLKHYDAIKFSNGYSKTSPIFECEYLGFYQIPSDHDPIDVDYSNGLKVTVRPVTIVIDCGKILSKTNCV